MKASSTFWSALARGLFVAAVFICIEWFAIPNPDPWRIVLPSAIFPLGFCVVHIAMRKWRRDAK